MFRKVRVPVLESDRLMLRSWTKRDASDLYEYAKDPRVGPYAGWEPHKSLSESRFVIDEVYLSRMNWAIMLKESGKVVGNIGLDEDPIRRKINSRELGYSLSPQYWGQGIVPEAVRLVLDYVFRIMELECITVRVETYNEKSRRVAEKCGFTFEGVLRHSYRRYDREISDLACYSMLAGDYYERKGEK
ncbi:MAG: GNAT family N-acetyltransferase [Firmicutes bacterium]|nr:GNAT family N-acetyltransferase [Bacillota bacterium]MBQ9708453.1 GNAT family N-acetyltransferase [Bacillota bacterium]